MFLRILLIIILVILLVLLVAAVIAYRKKSIQREKEMEQAFLNSILISEQNPEQSSTTNTTKIDAIIGDRTLTELGFGASATPINIPSQEGQQFTLFISARQMSPIPGYFLLQQILLQGMRFSNNKKFQRYEEKNGKGRIIFSLEDPDQIIDMAKIGLLNSRRLKITLTKSNLDELKKDLSLMIKTVEELASQLAGNITDHHNNVLTVEEIQQLAENLSINSQVQ